ncbi:MAG: hypothetical protein VB860_07355 [Dehalococcoidia bacterium]
MRTGTRRHRSLILNAIAAATLALIVACGGGGDESTVAPVPSAIPESSDPVEAGTAGDAGGGEGAGGSGSAVSVPDTASTGSTGSGSVAPTAVPAATVVSGPDPTATPPPTPPVTNVFKDFGFSLQLDVDSTFSSSDFVLSGWTGEAATDDQGLVTFIYNGADVVLFWEPQSGNSPQALVDSTYELQKLSKTNFAFTPINEGDLMVDGQAGKYGGFVYADEAGENTIGGLIGAWTCPGTGKSISLTTTSPDSTTLQIRFDRLLSGFECGI